MTELTNYTKGIFERINNDNLHDENNPFVIVFDGTVGEYLANRNNNILNVFVSIAEGEYLDLHAKLFGLFRRTGESDESLRKRILTDETLVESITDFGKLNCTLWVFKNGVVDNDVLTTRNSYLKDEHDSEYTFIATGSDSEYIKEKFLLGDILWLD